MIRSAILTLVVVLLKGFITFAAGLAPNVVYGPDDRKDRLLIKDPRLLKAARSSVALFYREQLQTYDAKYTFIAGDTYGKSFELCPTEPFREQPAVAYCSGVLVAPNLVLTAGHCVEDQKTCDETALVFDYAVLDDEDDPRYVLKKDIFNCKKLLYFRNTGLDDYALLELAKPVPGRTPVTWRKTGSLRVGDALVMIGHPSGLPQKIDTGGKVRTVAADHFRANVDAFYNNSGSPIFNATSMELEGLLIQGDTEDYVKGPKCTTAQYCPNDGCSGEEANFVTALLNRLVP